MSSIPVAHRDERAVDLVRRSVAGDAAAFAELVALYDRDVAGVCHVVCRGTSAAEDARQNAWTAAWKSLAKLREPAKLRSWLMRIAAREASGHARKERGTVFVDFDDHAGAQHGVSVEERLDLHRALGLLTIEDRKLVALRYFVGLSSREIGQIVQMNPSSIRSRLAKALVKLRSAIDG